MLICCSLSKEFKLLIKVYYSQSNLKQIIAVYLLKDANTENRIGSGGIQKPSSSFVCHSAVFKMKWEKGSGGI